MDKNSQQHFEFIELADSEAPPKSPGKGDGAVRRSYRAPVQESEESYASIDGVVYAVRDISEHGVRLCCAAPDVFSFEQPILETELHLAGKSLIVACRLVHLLPETDEKHMVGLAFEGITPEQQQIIRDYVEAIKRRLFAPPGNIERPDDVKG